MLLPAARCYHVQLTCCCCCCCCHAPQVKLNRGLDFVQLDDLLVDLKLTPDVLEVPVPRYFIEDRAKVRGGTGPQQRWPAAHSSCSSAACGMYMCSSPVQECTLFCRLRQLWRGIDMYTAIATAAVLLCMALALLLPCRS